MDETTKQLYKLFFKGEKDAVNEVVLRFRKELILFVNCYVHDVNQSEDIVSDVFVKIIIKKPKIKNESYFKTYIYQIAKNLSLDYIRHKKVERKFLQNYSIQFEELTFDENKTELYNALNSLSEEYRSVIYLKYFDDFSIEEIAKILKKNKKYVYNILERSKVKLKQLLNEVDI